MRLKPNLPPDGSVWPARRESLWTHEAQQDRAAVWDYIAADSPRAATRMDGLFSDAVTRLAAHPMFGRQGKILGTRELIPHENYRLVYEIDDESVWVLALVVSQPDLIGTSA
jgi:toxin ParE1/3/4